MIRTENENCDFCGEKIPDPYANKRRDTRFCDDSCKNGHNTQRRAANRASNRIVVALQALSDIRDSADMDNAVLASKLLFDIVWSLEKRLGSLWKCASCGNVHPVHSEQPPKKCPNLKCSKTIGFVNVQPLT